MAAFSYRWTARTQATSRQQTSSKRLGPVFLMPGMPGITRDGDETEYFCGTQIYCVFMFLTAASFFGILISQLNEIVSKQTVLTKELDESLESYLNIQPRSVKDIYNESGNWK